MEVIDHFLSKKKFTVQPSGRSGVLETAPKPSSEDLPKYYKSKAVSYTHLTLPTILRV